VSSSSSSSRIEMKRERGEIRKQPTPDPTHPTHPPGAAYNNLLKLLILIGRLNPTTTVPVELFATSSSLIPSSP
jgi:hypothetical protein